MKKVQERISLAAGVSKRSIIKISKEYKEGRKFKWEFSTLGEKQSTKLVTGIDDFNKCVTKSFPTLKKKKKSLSILKEFIIFNEGQTSFNKILKYLRFKWLKTKSNRQILTERYGIQSLRTQYLTTHYINTGKEKTNSVHVRDLHS